VLAKSPLLLLRSAPGGIVELVARSAQVAGKPWIDLAADSNPLSVEVLQRATGGVLWCEELARLTRLQQKNLLFAAERLDRYSLRLVAATTHSSAELRPWAGKKPGSRACSRPGWACPAWPN
jgi:two-component system nitrogen regulation response regulator NtrX